MVTSAVLTQLVGTSAFQLAQSVTPAPTSGHSVTLVQHSATTAAQSSPKAQAVTSQQASGIGGGAGHSLAPTQLPQHAGGPYTQPAQLVTPEPSSGQSTRLVQHTGTSATHVAQTSVVVTSATLTQLAGTSANQSAQLVTPEPSSGQSTRLEQHAATSGSQSAQLVTPEPSSGHSTRLEQHSGTAASQPAQACTVTTLSVLTQFTEIVSTQLAQVITPAPVSGQSDKLVQHSSTTGGQLSPNAQAGTSQHSGGGIGASHTQYLPSSHKQLCFGCSGSCIKSNYAHSLMHSP